MSKKKGDSMENKELNPTEYFDYLKEKKQTITDKDLTNFYNGCITLAEKYIVTGQKKLITKLDFLVECVSKEREIVKLGIDQFVYRDDIEEYIDNITKDTVKIIELENYPREIPDEIVDVISNTRDIFDKMYVLFTDYTGKIERQVEKERRAKDPIIFGTFQKPIPSPRNNEYLINDRFYFLGDWEDEYCDLTMDKFLSEAGKDKLKTIATPSNPDKIREELHRLSDDMKITAPIVKKSFFKNIRKMFKK